MSLDTPTTIETAIKQRDMLAHALGNLLQAMGIIRSDEPVAMTGPELLYQTELAADFARSNAQQAKPVN